MISLDNVLSTYFKAYSALIVMKYSFEVREKFS
jgi:hypothetical protein